MSILWLRRRHARWRNERMSIWESESHVKVTLGRWFSHARPRRRDRSDGQQKFPMYARQQSSMNSPCTHLKRNSRKRKGNLTSGWNLTDASPRIYWASPRFLLGSKYLQCPHSGWKCVICVSTIGTRWCSDTNVIEEWDTCGVIDCCIGILCPLKLAVALSLSCCDTKSLRGLFSSSSFSTNSTLLLFREDGYIITL